MTTDHNEAMRLADALDQPGVRYATETEAQAKLRRIKTQADAAALLRKLPERIAELDRLSTGLSTVYNEAMASLRIAVAERDTLRAEVERLRVDAERYQWLADCNNFYEAICLLANPKLTAHTLGTAIDTARKATP